MERQITWFFSYLTKLYSWFHDLFFYSFTFIPSFYLIYLLLGWGKKCISPKSFNICEKKKNYFDHISIISDYCNICSFRKIDNQLFIYLYFEYNRFSSISSFKKAELLSFERQSLAVPLINSFFTNMGYNHKS